MYTKAEANRVLNNPMTKQLVEWIGQQQKVTKMLMVPKFFHKSHSKRDREVLCILIKNFFNCDVNRVGSESVTIIF